MSGIGAIHGVDDTLKLLAKNAVKDLDPSPPKVTVGPLGAGGADACVNWFLYRIEPNPAFRNMEPPPTGWRTSRGRPPLALVLHYLLTAFPGGANTDGDYEQFSHSSIAAVMQALHQNPIIGEADPALSPQAGPLVEPLRITLDALDLESISKLWTAANQPLRLSVGYAVSLVVVQDPDDTFAGGPPVRERRIAAAPTLGPRVESLAPARASAGEDIVVAGESLTAAATFTLARDPGDPPGPTDWAMTVVGAPVGRSATLRLPRADLAPGARRLDVSLRENGLPVGRDSIGITVVPTVTTAPAAAAANTSVQLATAHATPDVEVFLRGKPLTGTTYVSPTSVTIAIPPGTPPGPAPLALRSRKVAGPAFPAFSITP